MYGLGSFFDSAQYALLPPQASDHAYEYDLLFWYINLVVAVGGMSVFAVILYSLWRFTRLDEVDMPTPRVLGSHKLEIAWSVIPLMFFMSFFVWGVKLYDQQYAAPADAPEYYTVGKQWMWKVQHPTGQREINELHIPAGRPIKLTGTSEDVIHDFGVPAFRSKIDVLPGRYTTTWYNPTVPGSYHIFCDQYCGMGHSQMVGRVHVMAADDYERWLEGTYTDRPNKLASDGSPAWEGRRLFYKLQCIACHHADATARAPRLEELHGKVRPLQGGGEVVADDGYLRESIRNPMAKVVDGWKPIMPAYPRSQVSEIELLNLVAYIKSLKYGDLPNRNDRFPAPVGAPGAPTSEGGLSR